MSASPAQDNQRQTIFRVRFRQRQDLQAQQDRLCEQLRRLYDDARVIERGIVETEKKLSEL